eukprot:TRINITY_DN3442_c0_g1_i2.p1 TRINITY_DN3442_c0_g1~~TRINITY_DN3442_c0_g1_i2.p1  ORF type:complete len:761 (-),score=161.46 TRINITY_DN3442_c0_g1_i2:44-2326(-)
MLQSPVIIPFNQIVKLSKHSFPGLPGTVNIDIGKVEHSIAISKIGELFDILNRFWVRAMNKMKQSVAFLKQEREADIFKNVSLDTTSSTEVPEEDISFGDIKQLRKQEEFSNIFSFPPEVVLLQEYKCKFSQAVKPQQAEDPVLNYSKVEGVLYLSSTFLCFYSKELKTVIPMEEIKRIKKGKTSKDYSEFGQLGVIPGVINITTRYSLFIIEVINRKSVYKNLINMVGSRRDNRGDMSYMDHMKKIKRKNLIPDGFMRDTTFFSTDFISKDENLKERYKDYMRLYGKDIELVQTQELKELIRCGIPLSYRGYIWLVTSGAAYDLVMKGDSFYEELSERDEVGEEDLVFKQIEKDLHRSLPQFQYFSKDGEGIPRLRKLLRAYARYNIELGYCQSMNIVAATLLLLVDEVEAFFLLCSIIRSIPEYYQKDMLGSIVDIHIFEDLIKIHIPDLHSHFENIMLDITMLAFPWFLCLFIGYVPLEVSLRIFDCFFCEGPNVLLQVGLAVLEIVEKDLLEINDPLMIIHHMKDVSFDSDVLLSLSFEKFSLDVEYITELRNFHKYRALQDLHNSNKSTSFSDLNRNTKFSSEELEKLYRQFQKVLPVDSPDSCLRLEHFKTLFVKHIRWWSEDLNHVFEIFDKHNNQKVSFREYVYGLEYFKYGDISEHLKISFDLNDEDGLMYLEGFIDAIKLLYKLRVLDPRTKYFDGEVPISLEILETSFSLIPGFDEEVGAIGFTEFLNCELLQHAVTWERQHTEDDFVM